MSSLLKGGRSILLKNQNKFNSSIQPLYHTSLFSNSKRNYQELKEIFERKIPEKQAEIKELREKHGNHVLTEATIDQAYMGMRGIKSLVTETSLLDADEGIRFRGYSIPECQEKLPKAPGGEEPLPEGIFWLLLTGEIPTKEQVQGLQKDLAERERRMDPWVEEFVKSLPNDLHPMTQFSQAILALQKQSQFQQAYREGVHKKEYWKTTYEDVLNCIARLPKVAALIYRKTYHNGKYVESDPNLDWGANFANMMGFGNNHEVSELYRLYLTIHSDHEGGNVSAHATHLVGSALSDPYLSLSAGMNGLAGPLHGLANQEVLRWLKDIQGQIGRDPSKEQLREFIWNTLNSGRVIPGYGHAVLRKTDPRYTVQREFGLKWLPDDPVFKLVCNLYDIVPGILQEQGKVKNPWPNVDAASGSLLQHYGIVEEDYYTVMFGVSRALGVLPSLTMDRALGLPIERPKSVTTEHLKELVGMK